VPAYIRLFDVAVAPYPDTPHLFYFSPLKVFEYMACGVPVAAPRAGQIADVIEEGETGVLYQAGDLDGLAARCTELIAAPERRARMGRAAATAVHARYTWAHNARRAMAIVAGMTTDMARANLAPERPPRACTQTTEVTA
jgi:glycosyltransferase involved in cell wall biosynthesis